MQKKSTQLEGERITINGQPFLVDRTWDGNELEKDSSQVFNTYKSAGENGYIVHLVPLEQNTR